MYTRLLNRFRRVLSDPATRPSTLNLGVALAYVALGAGAALVATLADGGATVAGIEAGVTSLYAFVLALLYLGGSYTFHWHASYTFERAPASFHLGTLGAALGLSGLVVQFVALQVGVGLAVAGAFANVLGGAWGTFVYTYRTYAPE